MAAPIPNQLKVQPPFSFPWAEFISQHGTTSDASFGYMSGNRTSLTIIINYEDRLSAINEILGTNVYNRVTGNLDRVPPVQHPDYYQCYASRIGSLKGLSWDGKVENPVPAGGQVPVSSYRFAIISIEFSTPRYVVLADADLDRIYGTVGGRQEWQRYVTDTFAPQSSVLQRPGGVPASFTYAEGPNSGKGFPSPCSQFVNEAEIHITWMSVPRNGYRSLFGVGPPLNMLSCLNCVNDAPFLGYAPYTLRFKAWNATELEGPVYLPGATPVQFPPLYYNLDLIFQIRTPPFDQAGGKTQYGHLAFPLAGKDYWYLCTTDGSFGVPTVAPFKTILHPASFPTIFKMNP